MSDQNMDITYALCRNVADMRFEDLDESNIINAKNRIIDVLGCVAAGANAVCNQELIQLIKDWGGKAESSILIHGGKVVSHNAALANSVMARSFDYESLGPLVEGKCMPAHISGTTVITAVTMAEAYGISGKELITALLSGDNLTARGLLRRKAPEGFRPAGTASVQQIVLDLPP